MPTIIHFTPIHVSILETSNEFILDSSFLYPPFLSGFILSYDSTFYFLFPFCLPPWRKIGGFSPLHLISWLGSSGGSSVLHGASSWSFVSVTTDEYDLIYSYVSLSSTNYSCKFLFIFSTNSSSSVASFLHY